MSVQQGNRSQNDNHFVSFVLQRYDYERNLGFDNISDAKYLRAHGFHAGYMRISVVLCLHVCEYYLLVAPMLLLCS
jgi:hypothetical protein